MITRKGAAFAGGSAVLLLAGVAIASAGAVAFAILLLCVVLVARNERRELSLSLRRTVSPQRVREDETVGVDVTLQNTGPHPSFLEAAERLSSLVDLSGRARGLFALSSGEEAKLSYALRCPVKGVFSAGPLDYRVEDVFGIFSEEKRHPTETYFTVYPRAEDTEIPAKSRMPRGFLGEHIVRQPGQGMEFFGLREYSRTDPLREVNWKASARAGELIVNQRERESITDVTILFDSRAQSAYGTAARNGNVLSARAVATLLEVLGSRRDRTKFVSYGESIEVLPPDAGERQRYKVLSALASLSPAGNRTLSEAVDAILPSLARNSPVVLVSNLEGDPTIASAIARLASRELRVVVLSPAPHLSMPNLPPAFADLARAERAALISVLRASGARVLDWDGERSLAATVAAGGIA